MADRKRRVNGAARRRARMEMLASHEARREALPETFGHWLTHTYKPAPALQARWAVSMPFVLEVLAASKVRGEESLRKRTTDLAHFADWAQRQGLPLELATMRREHTDEYCRLGMATSSRKSTSDRRARLRTIGDSLHPEQKPPAAVSIPRKPIKPPYTEQQMAGLRHAIDVQCPPPTGPAICMAFGLGAGCGIDSPDLKQLRGRHVEDHGDDGILVRVPGERAREVWVLRQYEPFVRRGLAGVGPDDLLVGRNPARHNVTGPAYKNLTLVGDLPHLEQSRLRTTWLATLMSQPVPLAVLMHAAGLKSTRTLFDLLAYLPATDPQSALREGGAQ